MTRGNTPPNICTVVVTYNGERWVENCFGSLLSDRLHTKICIVDNGSTDLTLAKATEISEDIRIIKAKNNLGFGSANNLGMKQAMSDGADAVFLLNQDAWVTKDTIETLWNAMLENTEFGVISPTHLSGSGDKFDARFKSYAFESLFFDDMALNKEPKDVYELPFVNAAAWLISRRCIEKVGYFDEEFFMYAEDNDYVDRIALRGLKVGICPGSKIFHDRELRTQAFNPQLLYSHAMLRSRRMDQTALELVIHELISINADCVRGLGALVKSDFKRFRELVNSIFVRCKIIRHAKRITSTAPEAGHSDLCES